MFSTASVIILYRAHLGHLIHVTIAQYPLKEETVAKTRNDVGLVEKKHLFKFFATHHCTYCAPWST